MTYRTCSNTTRPDSEARVSCKQDQTNIHVFYERIIKIHYTAIILVIKAEEKKEMLDIRVMFVWRVTILLGPPILWLKTAGKTLL
jgi:hypothetical protein